MEDLLIRVSEVYGYIRVSSLKQNTIRQENLLSEYFRLRGVPYDDEHVFIEKVTGKKQGDDRREYAVLRRILRPGDELVLDALDRLGRTKQIIADELKYLREKKVIVRVLTIPTTLIDLEQFKKNEWVIEMVNNILFEVYSSVAQQELEEKERRTRDGIDAAKEAGKYKGRKPIEVDEEALKRWYPKWKLGNLKSYEFQELLKLKPNTFYRAIQKYEKELLENAG